jgi:hypothetical protein
LEEIMLKTICIILLAFVAFIIVLTVVLLQTKPSADAISKFTPEILIGVFIIVLYFVPAAIGRKKKNHTAILVLNLLAGWTVVGWVIALIWALTKDADR